MDCCDCDCRLHQEDAEDDEDIPVILSLFTVVLRKKNKVLKFRDTICKRKIEFRSTES